MRAAVFTDYAEPLELREVDEPDPDPDGVVIETEACGICRSDWHAWRGDPVWEGRDFQPGHVFGHEPAGHVVAVGSDVELIREGDHVTVPFNLADGTCGYCRRGHANLCDDRVAFGLAPEAPGAFAERFHVPRADVNVVPLPDGVSSVDVAALGCRFMTAFHGLAHRADLGAGDWLAIHGCGGVGLSAVQIGSALGANVVAVDLFDEKLELATDLGAVATVNAEDVDDPAREVRSITDGGAHVAVDALGIAETCRNALWSLRKRGQHVQIGMTTSEEGGEVALPTDRMILREIDFLGAVGMAPARYDEIFRMVEAGTLDPAATVSETVPLADVQSRLDAMTDFETVGIPVIDEF